MAIEGAEVVAQDAASLSSEEADAAAEQGSEDMQAASEEVAATLSKGAKALNALKSFMSRNWGKILGSMAGAGIGATIAETPQIMSVYANKVAQGKPDLNIFLGAVATSMMWPDSVSPKLVSVQINGCLQFGVDPGFKFS